MDEIKAEDVVIVPGWRGLWDVVETGSTPGRQLAGGYWEAPWMWARVAHHDDADRAKWPGFAIQIGVSDLEVQR